MAHRALLIGALCAVLLAAPGRAESDDPPPPTDQQIKKMKIKELKQFIADRGLACEDCFEKGDFVKFVKKHRDAPLLPSKRPRKISKEPIQDQWKKVVLDLCTEEGVEEKLSKPLSKVVAGSFEMHARRISKQLHKEQHQLAKTSLEDPFYAAMVKTIKQTIAWQKKNSVTKQDPIRNRLDNEIKMFLTAVGADNVNPMYEKLNAKDDEL